MYMRHVLFEFAFVNKDVLCIIYLAAPKMEAKLLPIHRCAQ